MKFYIPKLGANGFMPKLSNMITNIGHIVTHNENDAWEHSIAGSERSTHTCSWISEKQNKTYPDWKWIDKTFLNKLCIEHKLPQLKQQYIEDENTIENCEYENFMIKPNVWSGARKRLQFMFQFKTKLDIEDLKIDWLNAPYELLKGWQARGFCIQETKTISNKKTKLITIDGAINGAGDIKLNIPHMKVMEKRHWYFVRSEPEYTDNDYGLSEQVETLLTSSGTTNALFKCEAIVDDELNICYIIDWSWTPIRVFDYHYMDIKHFEKNFQFAYDQSTEFKKQDEYVITESIEIPFEYRTTDDDLHNNYFKQFADASGVVKADILKRRILATEAVLYCAAGNNYKECRTKMDKFKKVLP